MSDIASFTESLSVKQKEIIFYFHQLLISIPGVTMRSRYNLPFYYRKTWMCYLNPTKSGGIELAFTRGNELSNIQGLLNSKGRKQVFGIEFDSVKDIPETDINEIIQEVILLDDTKPYSVRK